MNVGRSPHRRPRELRLTGERARCHRKGRSPRQTCTSNVLHPGSCHPPGRLKHTPPQPGDSPPRDPASRLPVLLTATPRHAPTQPKWPLGSRETSQSYHQIHSYVFGTTCPVYPLIVIQDTIRRWTAHSEYGGRRDGGQLDRGRTSPLPLAPSPHPVLAPTGEGSWRPRY